MSISPMVCAHHTWDGPVSQQLTQSRQPTVAEPRPEARSTDSHPSPCAPTQAKTTWRHLSWENSKGNVAQFQSASQEGWFGSIFSVHSSYGLLEGRDTPDFFCQPLATPSLGLADRQLCTPRLLINAHLPPLPQSLGRKDRCGGSQTDD